MTYSNENEQIIAVRKNWKLINTIDDPSLSVQIEAIKQNPRAILCIHNQTEELHLKIVELFDYDYIFSFNILGDEFGEPLPEDEDYDPAIHGDFIVEMDIYANLTDTSEKVQHAMLDKNSNAFECITEPYESVQVRAVQTSWPYIARIENPSEAVKLAAVMSNVKALELISNLSDETKLAILKSGVNFNKTEFSGYDRFGDEQYYSTSLFNRLGKLNNECQVEAVKLHWSYIEKISEPCEEAQLKAVKQSYMAINSIKKPSEAVQQEAAMRCADIIEKYNSGKASQYDKQKAIDIINKLSKTAQEIVVKDNWKLADHFILNRIICYAASRVFDLDFKKSIDKNQERPRLPYWYLKA